MPALLLCTLVVLAAPQDEPASAPVPVDERAPTSAPVAQADDDFQPEPTWKPLGKALWFDPDGKRLILRARVCLREGYLEHLLCLRQTKEHESVLATEAAPRMIHAGLLLTGAEVGKTVQFVPEFRPPSGSPIAIEAIWQDAAGQEQRIDARRWVKQDNSDKTLQPHWVFAGSALYPHPETGEMLYAADSGDLITVSNFMSSILDVPIASSADNTALSYVANTALIPPMGTRVTLILQPAQTAARARPDASPETKPTPKP